MDQTEEKTETPEKNNTDKFKNKNSEKKKKKKLRLTKRQIRYAAVTTFVLVLLLGMSAAFVMNIYQTTEDSCYESLKAANSDSVAKLESNLRNDRVMLRVIAGLIGNAGDIDSIEVSGYLSNYDMTSLITQVGMLLPEDELIYAKGRRNNADGALNFEKESVLGEHITAVLPTGPGNKNTIIRNFVPIRRDAICIGVLFSEAYSSSVSKSWLPDIFDKKGFCYVVNRRTGEIIINSSGDSLSNINDITFRQIKSDYTKEETIRSILDGGEGFSVFSSGTFGENIFAYFSPLGIEEWEMVTFVPESALFSAVDPIRHRMNLMIAAMVIILLLYFIWLVREIHVSILETEEKANVDMLTGLPNRNRYEMYLEKFDVPKEKFICTFIDANGLHELNNSKGHFAGDQMLRFIADTLKVQFGGEHIYRIGGDEFVVFSTGTDEESLNRSLDEFNGALKRNDYHAAVGSCVFESGMSVYELIEKAEKNMYAAKQEYYKQIGKDMRA